MKLESYIAKQSPEQRDLGPEPKERLATIINKPLTPENIDTYFDDALNETADLAERVRKTYEHIRKHPKLATAQVEDRAFSHFGLQAIPEVLTLIAKKRTELDTVNEYLKERLRKIQSVIVPPEQAVSGILSGQGEFERAGIKDRLKTFLYILKDEGVDLESIKLTEGGIRPTMIRQTSYIAIDVPSLNRLALMCDEEGNTSYIFDREKTDAIKKATEIVEMNKGELNSLLTEHEGLGVRFSYSSLWTERVRMFLRGQLTEKKIAALSAPRENLPRISYGELDPWKGFYTSPDGKHYASIPMLCARFGVSHNLIDKWIAESDFPKMSALDRSNQRLTLYSYEDIINKRGGFLSLPQTERSGEWKGFYEQDGKHYGPFALVAKKIGIHEVTLRKRTRDVGLRSLKLRDQSGRETEGYAYEEIAPIFEHYLELPQVNVSGEMKGFLAKDGDQFGTARTLAGRMGFSKKFMRDFVTTNNVTVLRVRAATGEESDAYSLKEVETLLKDRLTLPRLDTKGEWAGFYVQDGKHYGSFAAIAKKLASDKQTSVERGLVNHRMQKSNYSAIKVRDAVGRIADAYAYEDAWALLSDFLDLPKVAQDGEWKGFLEKDGKHYGNPTAIAKRLGVNASHMYVRLERLASAGTVLASIKMRDVSGDETVGYAIEDVSPLITK